MCACVCLSVRQREGTVLDPLLTSNRSYANIKLAGMSTNSLLCKRCSLRVYAFATFERCDASPNMAFKSHGKGRLLDRHSPIPVTFVGVDVSWEDGQPLDL